MKSYILDQVEGNLGYYHSWIFILSCKVNSDFSGHVYLLIRKPISHIHDDFLTLFFSTEITTIVESESHDLDLYNVQNATISLPKELQRGEFVSIKNKINPQMTLRVGQFEKPIQSHIQKLNNEISQYFHNEIFWNIRYALNPNLGSGVGSRGAFIPLKRLLLKENGAETAESVLDVGCGDIEIVKMLKFKNYLGIDLSVEAIKLARKKRPGWEFKQISRDMHGQKAADFVICLDVLIHQKSEEDFYTLIDKLTLLTKQRLVVTGFEFSVQESYMIKFHEDIKYALKKAGFRRVFKVFEYNNVAVVVADKIGSSFSQAKSLREGQSFSILGNYMMRQFEKNLFEF